jgi:hypothetical protein
VHCRNQDYATGIFQTIGFKEFHEYLTLADVERESERGRQLFNAGLYSTVSRLIFRSVYAMVRLFGIVLTKPRT